MRTCVSIDMDDYADYARLLCLPASRQGDHSMYSEVVPRILDLLDRFDLRATFFAIGRDARDPRLGRHLRSIVSRGHEVANHSYTHPYDFRKLSRARKREEICLADLAISDAVGIKPRGFRAPSFSVDAETLTLLEEQDYTYDSSIVPTPVMWALRLYAFFFIKLRAYDLGSAGCALAPLEPYTPDRERPVWLRSRSDKMARSLVEIPCSVSPFLRVPLYGTVLRATGIRVAKHLVRSRGARGGNLNIMLHLLDLLDPLEALGSSDVADARSVALDAALARLPRLWPVLDSRREIVSEALSALPCGAESSTLLDIARATIAERETVRPPVNDLVRPTPPCTSHESQL